MPKKYKNDSNNNSLIVSEAAVSFDTANTILKVASPKPENHLSPFEKMKAVRDGISKTDLVALKKKAKLDYTELAKALTVTRATLINKKGSEKFGLALSEKIMDIAGLYSFGFEIFGDEDSFISWMNTPNRALGYEEPVSFIDNQFGRQEVRNIIGRIAYGVYS